MKRLFVLLLALVMGVSLCACHKSTGPQSGGNHQAPNKPTTGEMSKEKLAGPWRCMNYYIEDDLILQADGDNWSVNGDIVTLTETKRDGTLQQVEYQLQCVHGWYMMVGPYKTYGAMNYDKDDSLLFSEIAITMDNWQDYFEFATYTFKQYDAFGDETGETVSYHLRLKAEYAKYVLAGDSEVVMRCSQTRADGRVITDELQCDVRGGSGNDYFYYGIYTKDPAVYTFEMLRVQGKIYLVNIVP